jgi:hypothetical protein
MRPLMYDAKGVITVTWVAKWAITALRMAGYYELDCSFAALAPYVYCIPLAVCFNVGIPLGLVVAPTERHEVFTMFAEALDRAGFSPANLRELPILSDEGRAPELYAQTHHNDHYLCYRHL